MKLLFFCTFFLLTSTLHAKHVAIQWAWKDISDAPQKPDDRSDFSEKWRESCSTIGALLKPGKGPYGWGLFESHSCYLDTKKLQGKKQKTSWLFQILQTSGEFKISLYYQPQADLLPKETDQPLASLLLEDTEDMVTILGSEKFLPLLLATLWDQAPFVRALPARKKAYTQFAGPSTPRVDPFPLPPPPTRMMIYKMTSKSFQPPWVAQPLNIAITDASEVKYLHSGISRDQPVWELEKPVIAKEDLWMHTNKGVKSMQPELKKRLNEAIDTIQDIGLFGAIAEALSMSVTSGYIGFRYGQSLVNQDFFEKNMSIMSLLFEIRAGPLQGIKFFADSWPSFSLPTGVEFGGNRQVFGWSFGTDLIGPIYVDLTPTFGRWSVHMILPSEVSTQIITTNEATGEVSTSITTETVLLPFELDKSLSAGLELGIELKFPAHLYRFGYSRAQALPVGGQTTKVTTSRYAVDTFHKIPFFEEVESSFLLFFILEYTTLDDSASSDSNQTTQRIEDVTFPFVFSGLGVTLSW